MPLLHLLLLLLLLLVLLLLMVVMPLGVPLLLWERMVVAPHIPNVPVWHWLCPCSCHWESRVALLWNHVGNHDEGPEVVAYV